MAVAFDTLAFAERLKAGGFDDRQAKAATEAFAEATSQELATKRDLDVLFWRVTAAVAVLLLANLAGTWGIVAAHVERQSQPPAVTAPRTASG